MKVHHFERMIILPRPIAEVFSFFSDAANLQLLTPAWVKFEILSPPSIKMSGGTLIDYRIHLHGWPMRWRSEITDWDPPRYFVDEQRRGPYRFWKHQHRFVEHADGTKVVDDVKYAVPCDWLIHRRLVRPDIESIFNFREDRMRELFPARL